MRPNPIVSSFIDSANCTTLRPAVKVKELMSPDAISSTISDFSLRLPPFKMMNREGGSVRHNGS